MPLRIPLRKAAIQTRCLQQQWVTTIGIQEYKPNLGSLSKMISPMTTPASTISSFNKLSSSKIWTILFKVHLFSLPKMISNSMNPCLYIKNRHLSRKKKRLQQCMWLREGRLIIIKSSHRHHLFSWSIKTTNLRIIRSNSKRLSPLLNRSLISTETIMPRGHPRRSYVMNISWGRLAFALSARLTFAIDACQCPNTALIRLDISLWWHSKSLKVSRESISNLKETSHSSKKSSLRNGKLLSEINL